MRVFALSDIHIDYRENRNWLLSLSKEDYRDDILLLAGDVSDMTHFLELAFRSLMKRVCEVMFVPGNHDLWIYRNNVQNSLVHFNRIKALAHENGVQMGPKSIGPISLIPLYGWYDYSFGAPSEALSYIWRDFSACAWPHNFSDPEITRLFVAMNEDHLSMRNDHIISFSHFMPRIDLMPPIIPQEKRILYPVPGTALLEEQIRRLGSKIHVYGHTHVTMRAHKDGVLYVNNAFGYPDETRIARKELVCVFEA